MTEEATLRDETLHASVLDEFDRDRTIPAAHVGVAVTDDLVTLLGNVRDDRDRLATVDAARRVEGVRVIVDAISVSDNYTDVAADHAIANRLVQILDSAPEFPAGVTLLVRNRVVTTEGVVDTAFDKQTVCRLAGYAPGVNWVRDNLAVGSFMRRASGVSEVDRSADPPPPAKISAYTFRSVLRVHDTARVRSGASTSRP